MFIYLRLLISDTQRDEKGGRGGSGSVEGPIASRLKTQLARHTACHEETYSNRSGGGVTMSQRSNWLKAWLTGQDSRRRTGGTISLGSNWPKAQLVQNMF